LSFSLKLTDAGVQFGNLIRKVLDDFSFGVHFFLFLLKLPAVFQQSLIFFLVFEVLFSQCNLFGLNFFLELIDLVIDDLVSPLDFCDLILRL
jgi:hypothetical protein